MAERAFHELLAGHLDAGTRPGLTAGAVGGKWTAVAFAKAVGVKDRTVRNWRTTGKGTLPNAEALEFILDALFGDDATLRAERLALQDAWDRAALAAAEPEPDGAIFVEGEERLELQQGTADDDAVARQPAIARRQALIIEKLQNLVEALGNRLDNQRGWRPLPRTARRLLAALENMAPEAIPAQLVEVYDRTMSLASFVDQDNALGSAKGATDDPLEPDLRRALADALSSLAPWLRSFPSVVQWDSARQDALTRPELFAAVRAQLDDARALIRLAGEAKALSAQDVALASEPLETARRDGFQAEKAAYRGLATARNLLTRATGIRALALTAAFYSGAVSSDFATKSTLTQAVGGFLARAETHALRLAERMPGEVAAAIRHVLTRRTSDGGTGVSRPALAANERQEAPEAFTVEPDKQALAEEQATAPGPPDPHGYDFWRLLEIIGAGRTPPEDVANHVVELKLVGRSVPDASVLLHLPNLARLRFRKSGVPDLSGFDRAGALRELSIERTNFPYTMEIRLPTTLEKLNLVRSDFPSLDFVARINNLKRLSIHEIEVKGHLAWDSSPLRHLNGLTHLAIDFNATFDADCLQLMTELYTLKLASTGMSNIAQLTKLRKIRHLSIAGNSVSDLTPLIDKTELRTLDVSGTLVRDLSVLSNHHKLESLNLSGTTPDDLRPLANLPKLTAIHLLESDQLDESVVSALKIASPQLQIIRKRYTPHQDPVFNVATIQFAPYDQ